MWAQGQEASLKATVNTTAAAVGQQIQVTYTLSGGDAQRFQPPAFKNFQNIGSQRSSGGGMTVIMNGRVVQDGGSEESWTYFLIPTTEGKQTLEAAKALVNGKWIESNPIIIEVYPTGSTKNPSQAKGSQQPRPNYEASPPQSSDDKDIFIRAYVDKENPYQGEQITLTYRIYTRVPIPQYGITKTPSHSGFWSEDLTKQDAKATQKTEHINGNQYTTAEIYRTVLFPQKSGKLTIEPLEVEAIAQIVSKQQNIDPFFRDFFNDPFFGRAFQNVQNIKKIIHSNAVVINAKPLPQVGKPTDFNGMVGTFTLKSELTKDKLKTNDATNLKITISGKGNIKLFEEPKIDFPVDFDTYDPKINNNITTSVAGVSGSKTFDYLLIPRNPGSFTIKPVSFSYFDINEKIYKTLSIPEFNIYVEKGEGSSNIITSGVAQEDIKYIGSDIHFIKVNPVKLTKIGSRFFGSSLFYGLLIIPFILFLAFVIILRKQLKQRSNIALMRNKKATSIAKKRLKKAGIFMKANQNEAFFEEVSNAIWGYLGDKFYISTSELSIEAVKEVLALRNIQPNLSEKIDNILNTCEFTRFAPAASLPSLEQLYKNATEVITKLEEELK